jgi:hypothetical protein
MVAAKERRSASPAGRRDSIFSLTTTVFADSQASSPGRCCCPLSLIRCGGRSANRGKTVVQGPSPRHLPSAMSNPLRQRSANCGLVVGTVCHGAETLHPLARNLGAVEFGSQAVLFRPALDVRLRERDILHLQARAGADRLAPRLIRPRCDVLLCWWYRASAVLLRCGRVSSTKRCPGLIGIASTFRLSPWGCVSPGAAARSKDA